MISQINYKKNNVNDFKEERKDLLYVFLAGVLSSLDCSCEYDNMLVIYTIQYSDYII